MASSGLAKSPISSVNLSPLQQGPHNGTHDPVRHADSKLRTSFMVESENPSGSSNSKPISMRRLVDRECRRMLTQSFEAMMKRPAFFQSFSLRIHRRAAADSQRTR
jgi:hypothetical protein